jgi:transcriptional regulator with XRE-family HTH domain
MSAELLFQRLAAKATLAKNLSLARTASGLTQMELAEAASVSRATIAQLESGDGDPRLSTVVDLAAALGTSPILLLMGEDELRAIVNVSRTDNLVSADEVEQMRRLVASGLKKQRLQAGRIGADAARAAGLSAVGAAIGSVLMPGVGTAVGATVGAFLMTRRAKQQDDE